MNAKKTAYLFPGQGVQHVGMCKEVYQEFPAAKKIFDRANQVLGFNLTKLCFEGPLEELTKSAVCQPAILTTSIALYEVLKTGFSALELTPCACAGLSLGEYTALVACGSLEFEDAISLVNKRGQFMDEASKNIPGTMSCILGMELEKVKEICKQSNVEIANLNSPEQIVISGRIDGIKKANELAQAAGAKRVIPLEVSGAFHSSLMSSAADKLKLELAKVKIKKPSIPFLSNVIADYADDENKIRELLIKQVAYTTFWNRIMLKIKDRNPDIYLEIGPGKTLRGLLLRLDKGCLVFNLEKQADFAKLREFFGGENEIKG